MLTEAKTVFDIVDAPSDAELTLHLDSLCNPRDFDIEGNEDGCAGLPNFKGYYDVPSDAELYLYLENYSDPEDFGINVKNDLAPGADSEDKPNDAQIAGIIANDLAKKFRFSNDEAGLYVYTKAGIHVPLSKDGDYDGSMAHFITNNATEFQDYFKPTVFTMVYRLLRNSRKFSHKVPKRNDAMVAFRNGVYNIMTGEFGPHSHMYGLKAGINANYVSKPELNVVSEKYFDQLGGSPEGGRLILAALGIIISNYRKLEKSIFFHGPRCNGKSTLAHFIRKLLPPKLVRGLSMTDFGNQFAIANLKDAHVTICTDLPTGKWSNAAIGRFKQTVVGDFFEAGAKGIQHDTIEPHAFVVLIANFMPKIPRSQDPEGAVQRRIWPIQTGESVAPDQVDPNLLEELLDDADDITSVAVHEATKLLHSKDLKKVIDASNEDVYEVIPVLVEDCMSEFVNWLDFTDNDEDKVTLRKLYEIFVPRFSAQCPEIKVMRINGFGVHLRKAIKDIGGTVKKLANVSTLVGYRLPEGHN